MAKRRRSVSSSLTPLESKSDVLFLLNRNPALRKALRELDCKLDDEGRLLTVPLRACPFSPNPQQCLRRIPSSVKRLVSARKRTGYR